MEINKLCTSKLTNDGHTELSYVAPSSTTVVINGHLLPSQDTPDVNWGDLILICRLLLQLQHHIHIVCGKEEYEFTMQTWKNQPFYSKHQKPPAEFLHFWSLLLPTTHFFYNYNDRYLISYGAINSALIKVVSTYKKYSIDHIWQTGLKHQSIITMGIFEHAFSDSTLITQPQHWKRHHWSTVVDYLKVPERIRYILSIPVPYFYSTFFPKFSSIEGVRLHEAAEEYMTSPTPKFDALWQSYIDPYYVNPKGYQTAPMVKLEPDVYCLTLTKNNSKPQALHLVEHEPYPIITK
jgi:hypothetical protein